MKKNRKKEDNESGYFNSDESEIKKEDNESGYFSNESESYIYSNFDSNELKTSEYSILEQLQKLYNAMLCCLEPVLAYEGYLDDDITYDFQNMSVLGDNEECDQVDARILALALQGKYQELVDLENEGLSLHTIYKILSAHVYNMWSNADDNIQNKMQEIFGTKALPITTENDSKEQYAFASDVFAMALKQVLHQKISNIYPHILRKKYHIRTEYDPTKSIMQEVLEFDNGTVNNISVRNDEKLESKSGSYSFDILTNKTFNHTYNDRINNRIVSDDNSFMLSDEISELKARSCNPYILTNKTFNHTYNDRINNGAVYDDSSVLSDETSESKSGSYSPHINKKKTSNNKKNNEPLVKEFVKKYKYKIKEEISRKQKNAQSTQPITFLDKIKKEPTAFIEKIKKTQHINIDPWVHTPKNISKLIHNKSIKAPNVKKNGNNMINE